MAITEIHSVKSALNLMISNDSDARLQQAVQAC